MLRFCPVLLPMCLLLSCVRSAGIKPAVQPSAAPEARSVSAGAVPAMILQAGEYPLWFQLIETGPILLDSIEDARFSAALIPWPLAPHIRFIFSQGDELAMAVNRHGFLRLTPWKGNGTGLGSVTAFSSVGLYHLPDWEFWRQYTVGAFILFGDKPAALLYRDDRFLDLTVEAPHPRFWTFGDDSTKPQALTIPALDQFPPDRGWDVDTLRFGADGFWYYRAIRQGETRTEIRMLRSNSLEQPGKEISQGDFQNSAAPEPLAAAPEPLRELLNAAFAETDAAAALVISPEFSGQRLFAGSASSGPELAAYYLNGPEGPFALAILSDGRGMSLKAAELRPFALPPLPEGFVYTAIGLTGDVLFAAWEEQEEYNIGAAGFMVILHH